MIELKPASEKDIPLIRQLAHEIWWRHYPPIIGAKQVEYMLDMFYSEDSLRSMMSRKHQYFLIQDKDEPIGFISIIKERPGIFFLHKFYLLMSRWRKGIGTKVLKKIIQEFQPKEIRLTVNRQNYKAINFYFKNKFVIAKVEDFNIGNGFYMNDFVMIWKDKNKKEKV